MNKRVLALCALLGGCAFFGKSQPLPVRYYDAEPKAAGVGGHEDNSGRALRIGHVLGASHLRERVCYHVSERELGFYDQRRWTERPAHYLRRAVARELFERRGLTQVVSGVAPTLELELTDFCELRGDPHAVRVRARALLVDGREVRFEQTFTAEQAVTGDDFAAVASALSQALSKLVAEIGDRVSATASAQAVTQQTP